MEIKNNNNDDLFKLFNQTSTLFDFPKTLDLSLATQQEVKFGVLIIK